MKLDNLTADKLASLAKPLTYDEVKEINRHFRHYVFYRTLKDGERECYCSTCGGYFCYGYGRTVTDETRNFMYAGHNDLCKCPKCGAIATFKNIGKIKSGKNLYEEERFVIPQIINKNAVLLRCYYANKNYSTDFHVSEYTRFCSEPEWNLSRVYLLRPGDVQNARLDGWWYDGGTWTLKNRAAEPFFGMYGSGNEYFFINEWLLCKSFLKYAAYTEYKKMNFNNCLYTVSFFCRSAELPALEVLCKLGYKDTVNEVVSGDSYNKRLINWNGKTPWEIFKLPKAEYKIFESYILNDHQSKWIFVLSIYRQLNKAKIKGGMKRAVEVAAKFENFYYWEKVSEYILSGEINLTRFINYIEKNAVKSSSFTFMVIEWDDYMRMATKLEYDIKNPVVMFPKDLVKAHDTAAKLLALKKEEIERKELLKKQEAAAETIKKHIKRYSFVGEKYSIIVPATVDEIIKEGKDMQHCVGGYADRHLEGKLCICFLRKNSALDKSYYTIEMHDEKSYQIQGFRNQHPISEDKKAEAFYNEWLNWVGQGSPRKKDGTPKINKKAVKAA